MISVNESENALIELGRRLRDARLNRNETMEIFAERIGVSIPTLRQMEFGAPTVQSGYWAIALWALGRLDDLTNVLRPSADLITMARLQRERSRKIRQRASRARPSGLESSKKLVSSGI